MGRVIRTREGDRGSTGWRRLACGALLFLALVASSGVLFAQSTNQVWTEYAPTVAFNKGWKLVLGTSYRTNLEEPRWKTIDLLASPEKKLSKHLDLLGEVQYLETAQYEAVKSSEVRLTLGARLHFTPEHRVQTGLVVEAEQRNILSKATDTWDHTGRGRIKAFTQAPLDQRTMAGDKVLYGLMDFELFLIVDENVQERYANRLRFRSGLGYKFEARYRLELVYMFQESANSIESGYTSNENVLRIIFKHNLSGVRKPNHPLLEKLLHAHRRTAPDVACTRRSTSPILN